MEMKHDNIRLRLYLNFIMAKFFMYSHVSVRGWMLEIRLGKDMLPQARKSWHIGQHHGGAIRYLAPGEEHAFNCGSDSVDR